MFWRRSWLSGPGAFVNCQRTGINGGSREAGPACRVRWALGCLSVSDGARGSKHAYMSRIDALDAAYALTSPIKKYLPPLSVVRRYLVDTADTCGRHKPLTSNALLASLSPLATLVRSCSIPRVFRVLRRHFGHSRRPPPTGPLSSSVHACTRKWVIGLTFSQSSHQPPSRCMRALFLVVVHHTHKAITSASLVISDVVRHAQPSTSLGPQPPTQLTRLITGHWDP